MFIQLGQDCATVHAGYAAEGTIRSLVFSFGKVGSGRGDRTKSNVEDAKLVIPKREKRQKRQISPIIRRWARSNYDGTSLDCMSVL